MVISAEKSKAEVAVVKTRAELILKEISKEKKIAEVKLAKAQPALLVYLYIFYILLYNVNE